MVSFRPIRAVHTRNCRMWKCRLGCRQMIAPRILIIGCWILFNLYWFLSAGSVKRAAERSSRASGLAHRLPTLLGFVLLAWPQWLSPLDFLIIPGTEPVRWLGAVVCFVGLLGAFWSRRTLGRNWSSAVMFKQSHELVEQGPYRFVRH